MPRNFLNGLREKKNNFRQENRCPYRDSKQALCKYKSTELFIEQTNLSQLQGCEEVERVHMLRPGKEYSDTDILEGWISLSRNIASLSQRAVELRYLPPL
jgi:hypothetical protein